MSSEITAGLHQVLGARNFSLELFGDHIAEEEGYNEHKGIDALRFYLMQKHGWTVPQVRAMSMEDIDFATAEERHGWVMPKEARGLYPLPDGPKPSKP